MLSKDILIHNIMPYMYIYENNIIERIYKKEFMNIIISIDSWTKYKLDITCFINNNKYNIFSRNNRWYDEELDSWNKYSNIKNNYLTDILLHDGPEDNEIMIDNINIRYMYGKSTIEINIDQIKFNEMVEIINDIIDAYSNSKFPKNLKEYLERSKIRLNF